MHVRHFHCLIWGGGGDWGGGWVQTPQTPLELPIHPHLNLKCRCNHLITQLTGYLKPKPFQTAQNLGSKLTNESLRQFPEKSPLFKQVQICRNVLSKCFKVNVIGPLK